MILNIISHEQPAVMEKTVEVRRKRWSTWMQAKRAAERSDSVKLATGGSRTWPGGQPEPAGPSGRVLGLGMGERAGWHCQGQQEQEA